MTKAKTKTVHKDNRPWTPLGAAPRIVTAPITAYVWGLFKQFVGLDQIISERS